MKTRIIRQVNVATLLQRNNIKLQQKTGITFDTIEINFEVA